MMDVIFLKFRVLVVFILLLSAGVKAQDPLRFIYIQTENNQPFYVKMDKQYLSSSANGYIIIAKLSAGIYQLAIGFPKNDLPELRVSLPVKEVNAGYLLKRSGDRDWGLVNLQTQEPIAAEKLVSLNNEAEITYNTDEFSKVLAEVVDDPSINQVAVVRTNPGQASVVTKTELPKVKEPVNTELAEPALMASLVTKLGQDSTIGGLLITYLDKSDLVNDTIKLFIPVAGEKGKIPVEKTESVKSDTRFIDMELRNPNAKADSGLLQKEDFVIMEKKAAVDGVSNDTMRSETNGAETGKVIIHTACKQTASQDDFLKLRREMAAAENEKDMTKTAGRQFAQICFTTEQVRNLAVLFITEDERYKFYVTAYSFVADRQNFGALEEQLADIYYKTRFKAMLNQ